MTEKTSCPGCEDGVAPFDHRHDYINVFGNVVMVWCIDGKIFNHVFEATQYLEHTIGFTLREAGDFLRTLPTKIN